MTEFINVLLDLLRGFFLNKGSLAINVTTNSKPVIPAKKNPVSSTPSITQPIVTLVRGASTDQGTFGTLTISGKTFITGELPWKENQSDVSCIPIGIYNCVVTPDGRMTQLFKKDMYNIQNVPHRYGCFIHPANWMGDTSKGYKCDLEGCIGVGLTKGILENQQAIESSGPAISEFMTLLNNKPFTLVIKNA